jgi:methyltransferase (TIGR00027 family)
MKTGRQKIANKIVDSVADTLYIPLAMKCMENNRKNAFFHDPLACEMIGRIDYDFSKYSKAVRSSVGVAIRAKYFDRITKEFIENNDNPIVVHVGCGLDARFQRLGERFVGKVVFYELDLPEVIELRRTLIPESKSDIYIPASMFETKWMDDLRAKHPSARFLFVVEGVFMYFEKDKVRSVFQNISQRFDNCLIAFDVVSSWMCRNSHRHDTVKLTCLSFRFACDDDRLPEQWGDGLRLESVRMFCDFIEWRKTGLVNYLAMKLIPVIRNSSRMLVYSVKR